MTNSTLDQRYGRQPTRRRARRGPLIAAVVLVLVLASAFVAWIAQSRGEAPTFKEVSFNADSPEVTTLDFELTKDDEATVTCAVQALNDQHAVVGWKEITVGKIPEDEVNNRTSAHQVRIRTTSPAHTATVDSCWNSAS